MQHAPYYSEFPKIAANQTRAISIFKNAGLPKGEYGFVDFYCNDRKCDCRRVMINVYNADQNKEASPLAVISYGWEPKSFYIKWSPGMPEEMLKWYKGPALDPYQSQSEYSNILLEHFKIFLEEEDYRKRLIRHYVQFKHKIGMKLLKDQEPWLGSMLDCGCGSGLKFKFCCAAK